MPDKPKITQPHKTDQAKFGPGQLIADAFDRMIWPDLSGIQRTGIEALVEKHGPALVVHAFGIAFGDTVCHFQWDQCQCGEDLVRVDQCFDQMISELEHTPGSRETMVTVPGTGADHG